MYSFPFVGLQNAPRLVFLYWCVVRGEREKSGKTMTVHRPPVPVLVKRSNHTAKHRVLLDGGAHFRLFLALSCYTRDT